MLQRFKCWVPKTKSEALRLLTDLESTKLLAGGTDLLVELQGGKRFENVVDITRLEEIKWEPGSRGNLISPLTTHSKMADSGYIKESFPALQRACSLVGSPQIRNMGTLGGNIANASPAADSVPPLMIYGAVLLLESSGGQRELSLEEILLDAYKTSIGPHEIITEIKMNPLEGYRQGYERLSIRDSLALSRLSVAYAVRETEDTWIDVRLAIGSITPVCFRAREFETSLKGQKKDPGLLEQAIKTLISQIREKAGDRPTHRFKIPILKNILNQIFGDDHGGR